MVLLVVLWCYGVVDERERSGREREIERGRRRSKGGSGFEVSCFRGREDREGLRGGSNKGHVLHA